MALGSFFGRINYNFKERYLFEANLRYDGSSRFVRKNRWSAFPSFSAAWRVTEEPFMAAARKTLSEFKIRASYGTLGNQNINSYYPASQLLTISSISAANKIYPIVAQNSLANEDITWETTYMTDIGFDATLWNRLSITADYYHKKTDGILMQLDIPSSIGLGAPYQNAGVVTNDGWEVSVGYNNSWGNFNFGVQANLSDVINEIVDMKGTYGTQRRHPQPGGFVDQLALPAQMPRRGADAGAGRLDERQLPPVQPDHPPGRPRLRGLQP